MTRKFQKNYLTDLSETVIEKKDGKAMHELGNSNTEKNEMITSSTCGRAEPQTTSSEYRNGYKIGPSNSGNSKSISGSHFKEYYLCCSNSPECQTVNKHYWKNRYFGEFDTRKQNTFKDGFMITRVGMRDNKNTQVNKAIKICSNCNTKDTPSWRRSLDRKDLLCNACGLYQKLHNIPRPITRSRNGEPKLVKEALRAPICHRCHKVLTSTLSFSFNGRLLCNQCRISNVQIKSVKPLRKHYSSGEYYNSFPNNKTQSQNTLDNNLTDKESQALFYESKNKSLSFEKKNDIKKTNSDGKMNNKKQEINTPKDVESQDYWIGYN